MKTNDSNTGKQLGVSWPLLVGAFSYLTILLFYKSLLTDADTYWHVRVGQWILEHRAIPVSDPFSHTMSGAAWTAHEWLSEVLLAIVYQASGWGGIVALSTLAFSATLAYLTRFLLKYMEPIHALMFVGIAIGMSVQHLLVRPHIIALPLLVFWTAQLVSASEERRTPSWGLLPIMTLWANLHGGFTLGLVLALAFALESVLEAGTQAEKIRTAKKWLIFLALSLAFALITPHGIEGLVFTYKIMNMHYAADHIREWLSPDFHQPQVLEVWLMVAIAVFLTKGFRLAPVRLILLLALLHLALKHVRSIELLGLLAPLFFALPFSRQWYAQKNTESQSESIDRFFRALSIPATLPAVLITWACLGLVSFLAIAPHDAYLPSEDITPAAAIRAIRDQHISGPVFNGYGFGGYLIFSGVPPFIDGRADLYGDKFIEEYSNATNLQDSDSLEKVLAKYHVEWTLLAPTTPAVALLDHMPEWQRLYADKIAIVHIKRKQPN
jgi:hypothetical protein